MLPDSFEAKYDNRDSAIFLCCSAILNGRIPHYSAPTDVISRNQLSGYTIVRDSCFNNVSGQELRYKSFWTGQKESGAF